MNIFVVNPDPVVCAQALDDKRVNKMLIETVQMLSVYTGGPYRPTHVNHPCTRWVGASDANLYWTWRYLVALEAEYEARRGKPHLSFVKFMDFKHKIPFVACDPVDFVNCSLFKDESDVFLAYQKTLSVKWDRDRRPPTWYGR